MEVQIENITFKKENGGVLYIDVFNHYRQQRAKECRNIVPSELLTYKFYLHLDWKNQSYKETYVWKWLKEQKAVKESSPKTLREAYQAVIGTVTTLDCRKGFRINA